MKIDQKYQVTWRDQTSEPHTVEEIRNLLDSRKIHSLFKVDSDGREIPVREFLAGLNDARKRTESESARARPAQVAIPKVAAIKEVQSHSDLQTEAGSPTGLLLEPPNHEEGKSVERNGGAPVFGQAVTSFVLSLLFILPIVNVFAWIISLVFGHIFLSAAKGDRTRRGYAYAWSGIWLTYTFAGFYVILILVFSVVNAGNEYTSLREWITVVHVMMVVGTVISCVVSGLLIAGTKMLTGSAPQIGVAFVAGTVGVMAGLTFVFAGTLTLGIGIRNELAYNLIFALLVLLVQAVAWSELIRIKDNEKLGFGRAMVVSLFCTVCQVFLGFVLTVAGKLLF